MSKLLFIRPDSVKQFALLGPPLELLESAGFLQSRGHEVVILDFLNNPKIPFTAETLKGFDFVLVAYYSMNRVHALKIIKKIKKYNPTMLVVAGTVFNNDSQTTTMWHHVLTHIPQIDICTIGECEYTLADLAEKKELNSIPGIAYRREGKVVKNNDRVPEKNLDVLGAPAWNLIDFTHYPKGEGVYNGIDLSREVTVPVRFSRGCPGSCKYCALWWVWQKWRTKSGLAMFKEIHDLYMRYGVRNFEFRDDCFGVNKKELEIFCDEIIRSGIKIAFLVSSRVDVISEEYLLIKLRDAGCYNIAYGVETGSQTILDEFNKEVDAEQMKKTLQLVKRVGLKFHALMIVGSPKETPETINETIDFLNAVDPDSFSTAGGLLMVPGTMYYNQAVRDGYMKDDFWLSNKSYKADFSVFSKFRLFIFTQAVRNRTKIIDLKNEYSFKNYVLFFGKEVLHMMGLKRVAEWAAHKLLELKQKRAAKTTVQAVGV